MLPRHKSFSEQNRSWRNRGEQWRRAKSHVYVPPPLYPRPPPRPPSPPIEISKTTKIKLKKFAFRDTEAKEENPVEARDTNLIGLTIGPDLDDTDMALAAPAEADKEMDVPRTQPDKVTPEFLSIHVGTPRARFAWQDLAGTPDTPRVHESLGISPNAQLSWATEAESHLPPPPAAAREHERTKRRRSHSPPSSPSNARSRRAAENVQKFKEALKTTLANPAAPAAPAARNRLARHHTALGTGSAARPAEQRPSLGHDGPSPRGGLRRTVSCGTPVAKRQRTEGPIARSPAQRRYGQTAAETQDEAVFGKQTQPVEAEALLEPQPETDRTHESIPDTESMDKTASEEDADKISDYGDDDYFDEDTLAQIDASIAPSAPSRAVPASDDFGDVDDDLFAAAEDLMAGIHTKPTTPPAPAPAVVVLDDTDDMYGDDDFGADFDFDAAEKAATQAATQTAKRAHILPSSLASGPKPRAIQRYLVKSVTTGTYTDERQRPAQEKILVVQGERSNATRTVCLRGDWAETPASEKSFVHIIGDFDERTGTCVVDNDNNMLILHPDQLVSATVVADSFTCTRRAVLQDRVKATSEPTPALVYGTVLHEIFQEALMANRWDGAFLRGAVDRAVDKHLEKLYTIHVEPAAAREHLLTQTRDLGRWADTFVCAEPKENSIVQGRNGERVRMSINKLLDVEEHVWSPMYGLKGNIDATVQVTMEAATGQRAARRTLTVPFELKTGRNASSSHQAQTVLYNLLLSDRYDIGVAYGVLFYLESGRMLRIPAIRHELRHMILQRNELACHVRERSARLPAMKRSTNDCGRCYAQAACYVYHRLADEGDGETSGMGEQFEAAVRHLTPRHRAFFLKWEDLLTLEERESRRLRRELWTMVSAEREKLGRCFGEVVLAGDGDMNDMNDMATAAAEADGSSRINRFRYTFVKEAAAAGFSFLDSQLVVGEPIVVSDEAGHFALAIGYVTAVRRQRIEVAVDRRLHNARLRQPGFDEETNQVFGGIMEVVGGGGNSGPRTLPAGKMHYRLDKDEFSNGMATVRNNLVQIMAGPRAGDGAEAIRRLVVDLEAPRFRTTIKEERDDTGDQAAAAAATTDTLNVDQRQAIAKVMSAQDYALVLGMPGTGKTTTIAYIIRALVRQKKSVLLASYTHSAVDNILLKLRETAPESAHDAGPAILRLGAPAKVHPAVREFALLAETVGATARSFATIRQAWHDSPVVATTCLGIGHGLFQERTFDYCIVDEASQITLPICLGPIRMARTFVLVGDHNQLPPLVQNEGARLGGLDVSLFKRLSDAHPGAVTSLAHQYRMCEDVMTLSNTLIYNGRLRCGYEALRHRSLAVPGLETVLGGVDGAGAGGANGAGGAVGGRFHEAGGGQVCRTTGCWLRDLLQPATRVAFVNTDALPGCREEAKGNRIVNPCEARVVAQLVTALLAAGVSAGDVGVMTHYRSQLALLRHQLRGVDAAVEMHTADRFQGRDKEVVVLSLVRSNDAGSIGELLRDWRRINVAFTRAKTKLLVVGSRSTLEKMELAPKSDKESPNEHPDMLARFLALMDARHWIYDLPADALDRHPAADAPPTQPPPVRSPLQPVGPRNGPNGQNGQNGQNKPTNNLRAGKLAVARRPGKENVRQPLRRLRPGEGVLLKGKPILQNIMDEMGYS